jgi:hypothetical protein
VGSRSGRVKPKKIELAFDASPLSMQYNWEGTKTGLARNQENMPEWIEMTTPVFQFEFSVMISNILSEMKENNFR